MDSITIRLQSETLEEIGNEAEKRDISKSEVIREWFDDREQLQSECEKLRTECERLRNEKRLILEQREENAELANYAESERAYREAGLATRLKWWLRGRDRE